MAKVKRYADEGEVTESNSSITAKRADLANPGAYKVPMPKSEIEDESDRGEMTAEQQANSDETNKPKSFKDAFASARSSGDKTFTFNGKSYTTELASSKPSTGSSAPAKTSAPKLESTSTVDFIKNKSGKVIGAQAKKVEKEETPTRVGNKTTEEGLARMRAKDEAIRNAPSPLDNIKSLGKKLREKAGITSYKKGGMTASSRADGIAQRGKTRGKMC